ELINWVSTTNPNPSIDYIVICGNLISSTANPSDYENASDILMELSKKLLVTDSATDNEKLSETRLSRILIVPGQNEFSNETNKNNFIKFYRNFFEEEYKKGRIVNFYSQFMLYR